MERRSQSGGCFCCWICCNCCSHRQFRIDQAPLLRNDPQIRPLLRPRPPNPSNPVPVPRPQAPYRPPYPAPAPNPQAPALGAPSYRPPYPAPAPNPQDPALGGPCRPPSWNPSQIHSQILISSIVHSQIRLPLSNPHFINRPCRPPGELCPIHGIPVPVPAPNLVPQLCCTDSDSDSDETPSAKRLKPDPATAVNRPDPNTSTTSCSGSHPRKEDEDGSTDFHPSDINVHPAPNRPPHSGNKMPSCINRQAPIRAPQDRSCNNPQAPAPQSLNNPTQIRSQSPNLDLDLNLDPPNADEGTKSDSYPRNADERINLQPDNGKTAPNPQTSASSFDHPSSSRNQAPDLSGAEPTDCELNPQEDGESSQHKHVHRNI